MIDVKEKMVDIRMVAIDLDGTLLTDAKAISEPTVEALRKVSSRGVRVVIASARPPRSVRPFYEQLGLDTLQINYNGALIWDETNKRAIFHGPMEGELVRQVARHARELHPDVLVSLEVMDRWYTDRVDPKYLTETAKVFTPDCVAPIETFCGQPVTKLMLLGEPGVILNLERVLNERYAEQISTTRCDADLLQIMNRQVSKAAALRRVAEYYGLAMEQVMAIGDAPNDVEMLQAAGVAVAVGNAHPAAKAAADWVSPDNNSHGVMAALERFGVLSGGC
ncbi:MAG: Cof-type HAD-IIB family hydrolase [Bacillota bacterium]